MLYEGVAGNMPASGEMDTASVPYGWGKLNGSHLGRRVLGEGDLFASPPLKSCGVNLGYPACSCGGCKTVLTPRRSVGARAKPGIAVERMAEDPRLLLT